MHSNAEANIIHIKFNNAVLVPHAVDAKHTACEVLYKPTLHQSRAWTLHDKIYKVHLRADIWDVRCVKQTAPSGSGQSSLATWSARGKRSFLCKITHKQPKCWNGERSWSVITFSKVVFGHVEKCMVGKRGVVW